MSSQSTYERSDRKIQATGHHLLSCKAATNGKDHREQPSLKTWVEYAVTIATAISFGLPILAAVTRVIIKRDTRLLPAVLISERGGVWQRETRILCEPAWKVINSLKKGGGDRGKRFIL